MPDTRDRAVRAFGPEVWNTIPINGSYWSSIPRGWPKILTQVSYGEAHIDRHGTWPLRTGCSHRTPASRANTSNA